jgi:NDP-sugar pyrophosphorylase family protein
MVDLSAEEEQNVIHDIKKVVTKSPKARGENKFQAVINHTIEYSYMYPFSNYTSHCLVPIGCKPLLSYQLEHLEAHDINDIFVVIGKKHSQKVQKFLKGFFQAKPETQIHLVTTEMEFDEECNVLKLLKEKITSDFVYVQGHCLTDLSLLKVIDYHVANDSACTVIAKEWDSNFKPKFFVEQCKIENRYQIYGVSQDHKQVQRLVLKKENTVIEQNKHRMHKSFLKNCKSFVTRTDLSDTGLFFCKFWLLNLLCKIKEDTNGQVDPVNIDEFLNFLIKNQYKKKLYSYIIPTQAEKRYEASEDIAEAISKIMDPYYGKKEEDKVKVLLYVVTNEPGEQYPLYHQTISNVRSFMQANQDATKLQYRPCFREQPTFKTLYNKYKDQIEENKNQKLPYDSNLPQICKLIQGDCVVWEDI